MTVVRAIQRRVERHWVCRVDERSEIHQRRRWTALRLSTLQDLLCRFAPHAGSPPAGARVGVRAAVLTGVVLLAAGCASDAERAVRSPSNVAPVTVAQAQAAPERYKGQRLRWGGSILSVHNREDRTEIELLSRPLRGSGEPDADTKGTGRFLVELPGFADPEEFPAERLLTVVGRLKRVETRPVGEFPYPYPVISAESRFLWPKPRPQDAYPIYPLYRPFGWPGWYHPYRDPWYW